MATNWKLLSDEQKAEINRKRRENYSKLDLGALSKIQQKSREYFQNQTPEEKEARNEAKRTQLSKNLDAFDKGNIYWEGKTLITDPDLRAMLLRINRKMVRRKENWLKRMEVLTEWAQKGGPFPWPNLVQKAKVTELWLRTIMTLGRSCSCCGTTEMFDFSWRVVPKHDTLCFTPFTEKAYTRVVNNIKDYELLCLKCAFDLKIHLFAWIFSPYSPRNCTDPNKVVPMFTYGRYTKWKELAPVMYPSGYDALAKKIHAGEIRSMTCGIKGSDGKFLRTFIRKNQYYGWVGLQPTDFNHHVVIQAKYLLQAKNPSGDYRYWGWGETPWETNMLAENCGWDALSDSTKRFVEEQS